MLSNFWKLFSIMAISNNLKKTSIDPRGRPSVTAGSDHCFCTCRPSVCPHFSNLAKQNKVKTMFATGRTVGLAKWIIDDTCLVSINLKGI